VPGLSFFFFFQMPFLSDISPLIFYLLFLLRGDFHVKKFFRRLFAHPRVLPGFLNSSGGLQVFLVHLHVARIRLPNDSLSLLT